MRTPALLLWLIFYVYYDQSKPQGRSPYLYGMVQVITLPPVFMGRKLANDLRSLPPFSAQKGGAKAQHVLYGMSE